MNISSTELQNNLSKYLKLSQEEDITITKRGKPMAVLTNPSHRRLKIAQGLLGILPSDIDVEQEIKNRKDEI